MTVADAEARRARLSELCLAVPEAAERGGQHSRFDVRGRTFAYYLNDHHGDGIVAIAVKVGPGDNDLLVRLHPERYYLPTYLWPKGWVTLRLDALRVIYLLDTNAVIALLRNVPTAVRGRLRNVLAEGEAIVVSSIVLYELWYGVARSERRRENAARLRTFLAGDVSLLPFEDEDAMAAGKLRASLERAGTPIGPYDLLIAAQAVRRDATVVTANVSEFARVPGLRWQDWAAV